MSKEFKTYILIYEGEYDRKEVKSWVSSMKSVQSWRYDISNSFYLSSKSSASEIAKEFRSVSNEKHGRFLVLEYTSNSQGWLPKNSWYLLNNGKLKKDT